MLLLHNFDNNSWVSRTAQIVFLQDGGGLFCLLSWFYRETCFTLSVISHLFLPPCSFPQQFRVPNMLMRVLRIQADNMLQLSEIQLQTMPKAQRTQGIKSLNFIEFFSKADQQVQVKHQLVFVWQGREHIASITISTYPCNNCDNSCANSHLVWFCIEQSQSTPRQSHSQGWLRERQEKAIICRTWVRQKMFFFYFKAIVRSSTVSHNFLCKSRSLSADALLNVRNNKKTDVFSVKVAGIKTLTFKVLAEWK